MKELVFALKELEKGFYFFNHLLQINPQFISAEGTQGGRVSENVRRNQKP